MHLTAAADTDPAGNDRGLPCVALVRSLLRYDYWLASNMLEFTSEAYSTVLYDNDNAAVQLPGYRADACTDAAIRYVAEQHKLQQDAARQGEVAKPFFLFISFIGQLASCLDHPNPSSLQLPLCCTALRCALHCLRPWL
jgi:hypothetical protein